MKQLCNYAEKVPSEFCVFELKFYIHAVSIFYAKKIYLEMSPMVIFFSKGHLKINFWVIY